MTWPHPLRARIIELAYAGDEEASACVPRTKIPPLAELAEQLSIAELVELLDRVADSTGNPDVVRACRAFRQLPSGRPRVDDAAALREADYLLATGKARSERDALMRVAAARTAEGSSRSTYERLRRKRSGQKNRATK